jgi:hypothetical protein
MSMRYGAALLALLGSGATLLAAPKVCVGSVSAGTFRLRVAPPAGGAPLPIRQVRTIAQGYRVLYSPARLPAEANKNARVALVAVPAEGSGVTVLEARAADRAGEWVVPFTASVVALVFGPQGLDEKRLTNLVSRDQDLVTELAGYAAQTEDLEDTLDALAAAEEEAQEDDQPLQPARGSPAEQVLFALTRALSPVMVAYNPLGAGRRGGPATLMGKAGEAFFENAGGVVPGGGALPAMKSFLMPDTEFRTVYAEAAAGDDLTLCAQRRVGGGRNRVVYLWAYRALNVGPPSVSLLRTAWLPAGARSTVSVRLASPGDWQLIDRVREWSLAGGAAPAPVKVRADTRRSIEIDLRKSAVQPGAYRLEGKWDWQAVRVAGEVRVAPPGDAGKVRLAAGAQERLVEGSGPVAVILEGTDFQFVERLTLRREGRNGVAPAELGFTLPMGRRGGPQQAMEIEIDTSRTRAGAYLLAMTQTGGASQDVPLRVLPPLPRLEKLPLRVNLAEREQRVVLQGEGLERIESISADRAAVRLGPAVGATREAFIALKEGAAKGQRIALLVKLAGVPDAVSLPDALLVAGPRPRITAAKAALPQGPGPALREGELPAGSFTGFSLQAENLESPPALNLECSEPAQTLEAQRVRAGERRPAARLDAAGEGVWFASFDPGVVGRPGCTVIAALETEAAGTSDPFPLGRVVRLPRIESIALTDEKADAGFIAVLTGRDLETIQKTGWDASGGIAVPGPPRSVAGEGDRQSLRVVVPWPSPTPLAPLYIWLAGDSQGRAVPRPPR